MANEDESNVPVLVAPREETIVDGRRVTFVWKPVTGATDYRLQISDSPSFEDFFFDQVVGTKTEWVVEDELPIDERTYYWRVVATDEQGGRHGEDNIESFISGTPEDEAMHLESPDDEEAYGPAERLVRGAAAEAAAEVTHAPRYVDEESALGVEHEGVEAGQILGLTLAVGVTLALFVFALFHYTDLTAESVRFTAAGASGYPELREAEIEATRQLSQYGVVDSEQGVYRIPIDRAIDLMANEARERPADTVSSEVDLIPDHR